MDKKRIDRGFELQGRRLQGETLTEAEQLELEQLKSDAHAELRTTPELPDPDGGGPLEASRPLLDGSDSLENFKRAEARDVARSIGAAVLDFLKGLFR